MEKTVGDYYNTSIHRYDFVLFSKDLMPDRICPINIGGKFFGCRNNIMFAVFISQLLSSSRYVGSY